MKRLNEITIIRPIVVLLCVVMHSFTIYNGAWPLPHTIHYVEAYAWIQRVTYSFMLETFVFISGYVFAFQIYESGKRITLKDIIRKKTKRLIIPSFFFSILNLLIFRFYSNGSNCMDLVYKIICGVGHMWFLPMLFLCFLFSYIILKLKLSQKGKLLLLFLVSAFSVIPFPFRISETMYYLLFFYLGIYICRERECIKNKFARKGYIIKLLCTFIITFVLGSFLRNELLSMCRFDINLVSKFFILASAKIIMIIYSFIGTMTLYLTVVYFIKCGKKISTWVIRSNEISMGVYVIHHFLLQFLYYKTSVPSILGTYWLPWISCVAVLFLSISTAILLRKTKIGRFLLG